MASFSAFVDAINADTIIRNPVNSYSKDINCIFSIINRLYECLTEKQPQNSHIALSTTFVRSNR